MDTIVVVLSILVLVAYLPIIANMLIYVVIGFGFLWAITTLLVLLCASLSIYITHEPGTVLDFILTLGGLL